MRSAAVALLGFLVLHSPARVHADQWTLKAKIGDPSAEHPPAGLLWKCIYAANSPTQECGGPFEMGQTLQIELPVRPSHLGVSDAYVVEGSGTKSYYVGRLQQITSPTQTSLTMSLGARWGNVWGIVKLPGGTPLPNVIVGAYNASGGLVAQATTDEFGIYEFDKPDLTEIEVTNHWVLPVDFHTTEGGFDSKVYYLAPSSMGANAPGEMSSPWKRKHVVHSSTLSRQDLVIGIAEDDEDSNEHDDQCEEEVPEEEEDPLCPVPSGEGEPVHLVTGSVYLEQRDTALAGTRRTLGLTRRYNSRRAYSNKVGAFGRGWTHSFEKAITEVIPGRLIRLNKGDSAPVFLHDQDQDGVFRAELPAYHTSWIVKTGGSYVRHFPQGGEEHYSAAGLLVEQVDRVGNRTLVSRDEAGKIASITAPGGRSVEYSYDGSRIVEVADSEGVLATYAYVGDQLDRVSYPDGTGYRFNYDGSGQLLSASDASGGLLEAHVYSAGRALTSEIAEGDERLIFSYDRPAFGPHQTTVTEASGNTRVYGIGDRGGIRSVVSLRAECPTCDGGAVQTTWGFGPTGQIVASVTNDDQAASGIQHTRDANGFVLATILADGSRTEYTRDSLGRPLTRTDAASGVTTWTYGSAGPLTIKDGLNRTTNLEYGTSGLVTAVVDPSGRRTQFGYNSQGDLVSMTDPRGKAYSFERDGAGRRTAVVDPNQERTEFAYDAQGRLSSVVRPGGLRTEMSRDVRGRIRRITQPGGSWTEYEYDLQGRLRAIRDAASGVVRFEYDRQSRLVALTDPNANTTRYTYDALGRVLSVAHPAGGQDSFSYDLAGRLLRWTNRNGVVTSNTYDAGGRLTRRAFSDGTPEVRNAYDQVGRLTSAANGSDALTWTYDAAGQVLTERSDRNASVVTYTYSPTGERTSVSLNGATVAGYDYDEAGRLATISSSAGDFAFGYDDGSRRTSLTAPNGVVTTYAYDDASRLSQIAAVLTSTAISSVSYAHDAASNRVSKTIDGVQETYGYDLLNRLTSVTKSSERTEWTYDRVGNRLNQTAGGQVERSTYSKGNRLESRTVGGTFLIQGQTDEASQVTVNGQQARLLPGNTFEARIPVAPGTNEAAIEATDASGNLRRNEYEFDITGSNATYTYDAAGSLIGKSEDGHNWSYSWNALGQLVRVTKNGAEIARFEYDALARRIRKLAGGVTSAYCYDGVDIVRESGSGGAFTYIHGPRIDEALGRIVASGDLAVYHADGLGSVVAETDASGHVTETQRYDAWGSLEVSVGRSGYAFTGREWDPEIGLHYYRARYYDPRMGRFIGEDPIRFAGGLNLYGYVDGNPIRFVDPTGLETVLITTYDGILGSHSALLVSRRGQEPFLYDPNGTYRNETRGSGGFFEGDEVNLLDYIKYHQDQGSRVELTGIPTTPEQEKEIRRRAMEIGDPRGFLDCATNVSGALGGSCSIDGSSLPDRLNKQAKKAQCTR